MEKFSEGTEYHKVRDSKKHFAEKRLHASGYAAGGQVKSDDGEKDDMPRCKKHGGEVSDEAED